MRFKCELNVKPCILVPHMIMKVDSLASFVSGYEQDFNYNHRVVFSFLPSVFSLCSIYPLRIWVEISSQQQSRIDIIYMHWTKCRRWYTLRIWVVVKGIYALFCCGHLKSQLFPSNTLVNRNLLNDLRATWNSCSFDKDYGA